MVLHCDFTSGQPWVITWTKDMNNSGTFRTQSIYDRTSVNAGSGGAFIGNGFDTLGDGACIINSSNQFSYPLLNSPYLTVEAVASVHDDTGDQYGALFSIYNTLNVNSIELINKGADKDDLMFRCRTGGSNAYCTTDQNFMQPYGEFRHILASYDGTIRSIDAYKIFIDGIDSAEIHSGVPSETLGSNWSSAPAGIGFWDPSNRYWNGVIKSVTLYKMAVSGPEMAAAMFRMYGTMPLVVQPGISDIIYYASSGGGGWSHKVNTVTNPAYVDTIARASINTINQT